MHRRGAPVQHLSSVDSRVNTTSDWVSIPNNQNELNRDTHNPYAYPYFHSSDGISSACLLYDLIVEFAAIGSNHDHEDYDMTHSTSTNIDVAMPSSSLYFDISQGRRRLVRRVEARCMTHPDEIIWADSCGDTALHRLAQMARLPSSSDNGRDGSSRSGSSGCSINNNLNWILKMAKCIISANPAIVLAQNNWKETPLHQFAQHCGLPKDWDVGRTDGIFNENGNSDDGIDPTWYYETFGRKEWSKKKDSLVEFASLLASRGAASLTNYRRSTALHEAVQLSLVRPIVLLHKPQNHLHSNHRQIFNVRQQQVQHQKQQLQNQQTDIVHILIQAAPEAMVGADMYHHTPWMLALQTHHTNPQVLQILLDSEQRHHYNYNQHQIQPRSGVKRLLFRRQASYALSRGRFNLSAGSTRISRTQGDVKDGDESFTWMKTKFIARQFSDKFVHGLILARVPFHVLSIALDNIPQEELLSMDTTTGCRPLDLLLQQQQQIEHHRLHESILQQHGYSYTKQTINEWNDDKSYLSTSDSMLKLLTEANRQVASLSCGNSTTSGQPIGPFPLHLALQPQIDSSSVTNGIAVSRGHAFNEKAVRRLPWTWSGSLHALLQAYPMAVGYRDFSHRMFPFQLAAIHASSDEETDDKDLENTTMIYSLLRAEPSVLKCGN